MYYESKNLERDITDFERSVRELSRSINSAGMDWRDSKYDALRNNISGLAAQSKGIIQQSHRAFDAVNRFMKICSED